MNWLGIDTRRRIPDWWRNRHGTFSRSSVGAGVVVAGVTHSPPKPLTREQILEIEKTERRETLRDSAEQYQAAKRRQGEGGATWRRRSGR